MPRLLLLFPLLLPLLGSAQTLHQYGYWGRFFLRTQLAPRLAFYSEFDERRFAFPGGQWQFITHQHLHYRLSKTWDAGLGGSLSWQPQGGVEVPERRLFQEVTATLPLWGGRLRLQPRLRVDERWLRQVAGADLTDDWVFRLRARTRLQLDWHLTPSWKLRASDELMNYRDGFDQNRIYFGAERRLGPTWAVELGYLNVRQKRAANAGYTNRDVLRLTVFKDLSLLRESK